MQRVPGVRGAKVDAVQKRLALIEHLRIAIALASELGDQATESCSWARWTKPARNQVPGMSTSELGGRK